MDLQLFLDIDTNPSDIQSLSKMSCITLNLIFIESASWNKVERKINYSTSELRERIPKSVLRWQRIGDQSIGTQLPLYLNDKRSFKVCDVFISQKYCEGASDLVLAQRGVAFILQ